MYVTREDTRPPPQNTTNHKPQTTNHKPPQPNNRWIDRDGIYCIRMYKDTN